MYKSLVLILSSTLSSITNPPPPPRFHVAKRAPLISLNSLICPVCRPNSLSFNPLLYWQLILRGYLYILHYFSVCILYISLEQDISICKGMREHNSDNFNLSLFQCMCHFNKLFVKRSLGAGNSNSDTYLYRKYFCSWAIVI